MPPQSEEPPSPRPKSSSPGILTAFRSLTGQRKTPASLSASSTPATESANLPSFLGNETSSDAPRQPLQRLKTTPLPGHLGVQSPRNGDGADNGIQIGGPPHLQRLLDALGPENELEERIRAADSVAALLSDYPVVNVGVIWHRAKDLIGSKMKQHAFEAGYGLMLACINHARLELVEKPLFFASVSNQSLLDQPSLCLGALKSLTNNGASFEGLDSDQLASLLVALLDKSYDVAVAARKRAKADRTDPVANEECSLAAVFHYLIECIKFGSKVFDETHLDNIIEHVLLICRKTRSESDLEHSLELLDTIMTYSALPKSSLRGCVEVICSLFCSVETLKLQGKSTFWKLFRSYLGPEVLSTLQAILYVMPGKPVQDRNVVRGSVQLLREIVRESWQDHVVKLPVSDLLPALRQSLNLDSVRLELDVLNMLFLMLQESREMVDLVFADQEWSVFCDIVVQCSHGKAMAVSRFPSIAAVDPPSKNTRNVALISDFTSILHQLTDQLVVLSQDMDSDRKFAIMDLLLLISQHLNDDTARSVIEFFVEERLLLPSQNKWVENCQQIRICIFQDSNRSVSIRMLALETLCNSYYIATALNVADADMLALSIAEAVLESTDLYVLEHVAEFAVGVAEWTSSFETFSSVLALMRSALFAAKSGIESPVESPLPVHPTIPTERDATQSFSSTPTAILAKSLVKMFLRCCNRSFEKTEALFLLLLSIARSSEPPADARIIALKLLTRIRSNVSYAIFIAMNTESEALAAALCRTVDSAVVLESAEGAPKRSSKEEELLAKKQPLNVATAPSQSSTSTAPAVRSASNPLRTARPTPPLWMYPGPKGLPEDPPRNASHIVYSHNDPSEDGLDKPEKPAARFTLKTGLLLELALDLLQRDELEWETYSYLIVHLGAQLMNHALFVEAIPQIKLLRSVLCDLLQNKKFHEPPAFTNLKRSDVAICLYQILTTLVSHRQHFAKSEEDEMVKTFVLGIGSGERTSEICIHALSVCCHETPMSIVKYLDTALQKMIQIVTQSNIAVHILEFLAGLARLPKLFRNFREDEFKSVFGICFRYLQYVRDQRSRLANQANRGVSSNRPHHRDTLALSESRSTGPSLAEVLPQYVYALAYHVMTFWFISLKLRDRPRQMAWIRKNLIFKDDKGEEVMEEQSLVTIDLMHRVSYSDRDETKANPNFAQEADGVVTSKSFIVGLSILTVETAGRTGVSHITIRRPSGNRCSVSRPQVALPPRHQVPTNADTFYAPDYIGVVPNDVLQNLYSPLTISPSLVSLTEGPIPLPDDDSTKRSIAAFDRISPLDGHKVGIVYVGEDQTSEVSILANVMGSADYTAFLHNLGTLTELQGATFNTQGLDREYGTDGKFTFAWRDRVSELVFHVATMMPTDLEHDPECALKKRHIGNDFVNIIFNNSGLVFKFDTFPSDFNYVNIVISPEARTSFVETRLNAARRRKEKQDKQREAEMLDKDDGSTQVEEPEDKLFYKVTVMTKPGLPRISPASETKIVSGKNLGAFVRLLALNASVFAQVWANRAGGEPDSSWRSRLREIVRLRERNVPAPEVQTAELHRSPPPTAHGQGQDTAPENPGGRESVLMRRTSAATFLSDGGANRASGVSTGPAEMERSNSSESRG